MPYSLIENFLSQGPENTAGRWAGQPTQQLANEMSKLTHNWTGSVLKTGKIPASKAKAALDLTFPAGQESDDDEFQDIMRVQPLSHLLDLMGQSLSDTTISSNTTISGFNAYKNLTIESGNTLTLDGQPALLLVTNTLENNGAIKKTTTGASGGGGGGDPDAEGGIGGGGTYILVKIFQNNKLIKSNGTNGNNANEAPNDTDGENGNNGLEITVEGTSNMKNGGTGGNTSAGQNATNPGTGGSQTTTNMTSSEVLEHIKQVLTDLWLQNIENRNPSSTISSKNIKGNGGGGGDGEMGMEETAAGGGGGGSGGQILTYCVELNNQDTIKSIGGSGGSPYINGGSVVSGANNGGDGSIVIGYKTLTSQGTLTAGGTTLIDAS